MLTKILVPLDGSDAADLLIEKIARLDLDEGAAVQLVQVLPERTPRAQERHAREHLAAKARALHELGVRAQSEVLTGDPALRIIECAAECSATVIAMLLRGQTGPPAWMRGSVAERVLRDSPVPLLLDDPALSGVTDRERASLRRILVPIDPRRWEASEHVLPLVAAVARREGAVVLLLAVLDERSGPDGIDRRQEAERSLEAVHAQLGGVAILKRVAVGSPAVEILQAAADEDLVVFNAPRADHGVHTTFGSVAEQVLRRCPCPVLVAPPPARARAS